MPSALLSEVRFASLLVYSPRGQSEVSQRSRRVRDAVKRGDEAIIARAVELVKCDDVLATFLHDAVLVPAPRSAPLVNADALWPGRLLAAALVQAGQGRAVETVLHRKSAVPKSAFQKRGERPTATTHLETIEAEASLRPTPTRAVIVDDFVTKGSTMLAAASVLVDLWAGVDVAAFALVRTLGLQPEIERILDPCTGIIRLEGDEGDRRA